MRKNSKWGVRSAVAARAASNARRGGLGGVLPRAVGAIIILFKGMIRLYQLAISPFTPPACRYLPTCSEYAAEAIRTHGACYGGWLALKRIARCHPWGGSGIDNVPQKHEK